MKKLILILTLFGSLNSFAFYACVGGIEGSGESFGFISTLDLSGSQYTEDGTLSVVCIPVNSGSSRRERNLAYSYEIDKNLLTCQG